MKRLLSIFILLGWVAVAHAELTVSNNAVFNRFASSYFTSHRAGDYLDSAKYLYWPNQHIHCNEDSRGGDSLQGANEDRIPRKGLAQWATGSQFWGEIWADDNGGYTALQVSQNLTNTFRAPTNTFDGTTYTNVGGWAATNSINWIGLGAIPYTNQFNLGNSEELRNNAATNIASQIAYRGVDIFHPLIASGWSNSVYNGNPLRFGVPDLTHPGPPGNLDMAIVAAQAEMDTNVNTCVINYSGGSVSVTQHCVVSSAALTGNTFSFSWKADRHSMAWDVPGTALSDSNVVTNDATEALLITNASYEVLTFTNLPNGNFTLSEDGATIWSGTISSGRLDINLFNITTGANWNQRVEVLRLIRARRYCDEITLVDGSAGDGQGEQAYDANATTQWNAGKRGDALITALAAQISNLNSKDTNIWAAATPTNNAFALTLITPRYAPWTR